MINSAIESVLIIVGIILPGGLSLLVMRRYHPSVDYRSTLLEWSVLIYHASLVHFIGFWYMVFVVWVNSMVNERAVNFPSVLPNRLFDEFMGTNVIWVLVWIALLMMISVVSGIYDLPSKVTHLVARVWRRGDEERRPLLDQSIWFKALQQDREAHGQDFSSVLIRARMKNGDEYTGWLQRFPVLPDSSSEKDITITGEVRFRSSGVGDFQIMEFEDKGGVLLNTANISSLEYLYQDQSQSDGAEPRA